MEINTDLDKVRYYFIEEILNAKEDQLDKHYMTDSSGRYTRRELAKEIENNTEVGRRHINMMIKLVIDLWERKKYPKEENQPA